MKSSLKFLSLAAAAFVTVSAQAAVYSSTPNSTIPDENANGRSSTISVSDTSLTGSLSVSVGLTHDYLGDLIVRLTHGSSTVTLMDRPGRPASSNNGDSSNLSSTAPLLFSMSATALAESMGSGCDGSSTVGISSGCLNTSFLPDESLAAFIGSSMAGDWTLRVSDNREDNTGRLVKWSLDISPQSQPQPGAVPEPGSLALAGLGLAGILAARRRVQG